MMTSVPFKIILVALLLGAASSSIYAKTTQNDSRSHYLQNQPGDGYAKIEGRIYYRGKEFLAQMQQVFSF